MSSSERLHPGVRARLRTSVGLSDDGRGLTDRERRALRLAADLGAPAGPALAAAAAAARQVVERRRALGVATAQSRFVAAALVLLPVGFLPFQQVALGLPVLDFYGTRIGRAVGAVGLGLLLLGAATVRRLLRRVERVRRGEVLPDDEVADLAAVALSAGLPTSAALRQVGTVRPELRGRLDRAALALEHGSTRSRDPVIGAVVELLAEADRLGAAAGVEVRQLATDLRAERDAVLRARAERLPAQLTVPSVLLLLPATVLLVGAPVVAAGLAST